MAETDQLKRKRSRFSDRPTSTIDDSIGIASEIAIIPTSSLIDRNFSTCRSVDLYQKIAPISHGMYGMVFKAIESKTGVIVALKQIRMDQNVARDGFPISALREINILSSYKHPNILNIKEMVVGATVDKFFIVMDFCDIDLKTYLTNLTTPFTSTQAKSIIQQLLNAVSFLHSNWICHRDLKPTNILLKTSRMSLIVCDFGLARKYSTTSDTSGRRYTVNVVTLWYRCPELLLLQSSSLYQSIDKCLYNCSAVDIWSTGCIIGEILTRNPMFDSRSEPPSDVDQLKLILYFFTSGTVQLSSLVSSYTNKGPSFPLTFPLLDVNPRNSIRNQFFSNRVPLSLTMITSLNDLGLDLLSSMLSLIPEDRISAEDAVSHAWFSSAR